MRLLEERLGKYGSKPGLERMKVLMKRLGNPQDDLKVILIAGTNGKGSTTSFLSSILTHTGKKTGSFYSPHLFTYNERFRIDDEKIGDSLLNKYEKEMIELFDNGVEMTEFEALAAIGYRYFADEQVDYAVMEVGMGGEFDATNIAKPEAGIITNVDLEHTNFLGKTVEEIARTKAGILKDAVKGFTGCTSAALKEIESIAPVKALGRDFFVEPKEVSSRCTVFSYLGKNHYSDLETSLLGRHQIDNAALAIAAAEGLDEGLEEDAVRNGLIKADNPGRLKIISDRPLVIADAAHNPAGIGTLITSLPLFDYERLIVVFGVMETKDWRRMVQLLGQHADVIIANRPKGKSADPKEVAKEASVYTKAICLPDVKESLFKAKSMANEKDMVLICGSIYMLGELLRD